LNEEGIEKKILLDILKGDMSSELIKQLNIKLDYDRISCAIIQSAIYG